MLLLMSKSTACDSALHRVVSRESSYNWSSLTGLTAHFALHTCKYSRHHRSSHCKLHCTFVAITLTHELTQDGQWLHIYTIDRYLSPEYVSGAGAIEISAHRSLCNPARRSRPSRSTVFFHDPLPLIQFSGPLLLCSEHGGWPLMAQKQRGPSVPDFRARSAPFSAPAHMLSPHTKQPYLY